MKYNELTNDAKHTAEREIYEEMKDMPVFKTMFKALLMRLADRY